MTTWRAKNSNLDSFRALYAYALIQYVHKICRNFTYASSIRKEIYMYTKSLLKFVVLWFFAWSHINKIGSISDCDITTVLMSCSRVTWVRNKSKVIKILIKFASNLWWIFFYILKLVFLSDFLVHALSIHKYYRTYKICNIYFVYLISNVLHCS